MVILYRISHLSLWAVRSLPFLTTRFIGLANIVAGEQVVPELLFAGDASARIAALARPLWSDEERRTQCLAGLGRVASRLASPRPAADCAAEAIADLLAGKHPA
jgi:lipid-A-disaccharide synthase